MSALYKYAHIFIYICIGWNPFYKNEKKTIEAHILHKFKDDFYGSNIKLVLYGYLRPEADFESLGKKVCILLFVCRHKRINSYRYILI
jgi:FAD synthase